MLLSNRSTRELRCQSSLVSTITIIRVDFPSHRSLSILSNPSKGFRRGTLVMEAPMLINPTSHTSKFRKVLGKQVLPCPLLDRLYKSPREEVRQVPRISLRASRIPALKTTATASESTQAGQTPGFLTVAISVPYASKARPIKPAKKKLRLLLATSNPKHYRRKLPNKAKNLRITTLMKISITTSLAQKMRQLDILLAFCLLPLLTSLRLHQAIDADAVIPLFYPRTNFIAISATQVWVAKQERPHAQDFQARILRYFQQKFQHREFHLP